MFWILQLLILPTAINAIGQPHFECGEHGRFEYCIDGIPGCIVGCHCHPGYYFDTETKICEPNAKLVQEYRRLYNVQTPTRVPDIFLPHNELELEPTPTTPAAIDTQVAENLAKNNDDLGDWLYNQFFKTIENQVINDTDTTNEKPTRRSGGDLPVAKVHPRRGNKRAKNFQKKSKKKKSDLRRKLLRITEDDSLFDSSSGSEEESSDSETESDDDDTSDDTTMEHEDGKPCDKKDNNNAHGHRKILMINKKPKPPLPSFIFLPQMDTPFFPPIGLPPPAVPMYPMVPVPPMPMYPYPGFPSTTCSGKGESTTAPPTKQQEEETSNKPEETKPTENPENTDKPPDPSTEPEKTEPEQSPDNPTKKDETRMRMFRNGKHGQRNKILQQIQQQMQRPNIPALMKKIKKKMRKNVPLHERDEFDNLFTEDYMNQQQPHSNQMPSEDVDFKYITQLIHKMDNSSGHHKRNMPHNNMNLFLPPGPPLPMPPDMPPNMPPNMPPDMLPHMPPNMQEFSPPGNPNMPPNNELNMPSRRFGDLSPEYPIPQTISNQIDTQTNNRRHLESPNDSYYSNLGQQIANLIRKMDVAGDQRLDIELKRTSPPPRTFFSENTFGPKNFWERSVRSLLKQYRPLDSDNTPLFYEDKLLNLEKKVENIATTVRPLTLHELENFVFFMDQTKTKFETSTVGTPKLNEVDNSLNINLLPQQYERPKYEEKSFDEIYLEPLTELIAKKLRNNSDILKHLFDTNKPQTSKYFVNREALNGVEIKNVLMNTLITPNGASKKTSQYNDINVSNVDSKKISNYNEMNVPTTNTRKMGRYEVINIGNIDSKITTKHNNEINIQNVDSKVKMLNHNILLMPNIKMQQTSNIGISNYNPRNSVKNATMRTLSEAELSNLQRMVGTKFNEAASKKQLPYIPWLSPTLANILSHNHRVYRIQRPTNHEHPNDRRAPTGDVAFTPVNIQFQVNTRPQGHNSHLLSDDYSHSYRKKVRPLPMLSSIHTVRADSKPSFFRHEMHHLDLFR